MLRIDLQALRGGLPERIGVQRGILVRAGQRGWEGSVLARTDLSVPCAGVHRGGRSGCCVVKQMKSASVVRGAELEMSERTWPIRKARGQRGSGWQLKLACVWALEG